MSDKHRIDGSRGEKKELFSLMLFGKKSFGFSFSGKGEVVFAERVENRGQEVDLHSGESRKCSIVASLR